MTTPPDLPVPPSPPLDVPAVPTPEIRPYTGTEDLPGQSTPEVQPERRRPEESEPPGPPRVPPSPGREIEPPRQ
ncbi:MAG: hypothetical protein EHM78_11075 [Myxococcaceae bacterium]|nr:MAG: hypothetical protein EHM78_11075 [Myxococcaceae bacterium]